jgi:hypothetical protein
VGTSHFLWLADHFAGALLLWSSFLLALVGLLVAILLLARAGRGRLVNLGVAIFAVASAVLVGEVVARIYHLLAYDISVWVPMRVRADDILGWEGEKVFGDPSAGRLTLFVTGDSFTESWHIPRALRYHSVLGRMLNVEVFVNSAGGYGTLQEYLVLDRYLPEIAPNVVLLQVHSNDFINNSWTLERASYFNNNMAIRPYLIGDVIEYHFPARFGGPRLFLAAHSRAFYEAIVAVDRLGSDLAHRGYLHTVESDIALRGLTFDPFRESVRTTGHLIARMKARLGTTPLVAVPADYGGVFFEQWRRIFLEHEIPFLESPALRILEAEQAGAKPRPSNNPHWNTEGHEIVGRVLAEWLSQHGYLRR